MPEAPDASHWSTTTTSTTRSSASMRIEKAMRGLPRRGPACGAGVGGRNDLVEDLVLANHAQLESRALLERFHSLFQIPHLRVERVVTRLEFHVGVALLREAAVQFPHPRPASPAEPQRILQREKKSCKYEG